MPIRPTAHASPRVSAVLALFFLVAASTFAAVPFPVVNPAHVALKTAARSALVQAITTEDVRVAGSLTALWNGSGTAPAGSVVSINAPAGSVLAANVSGTFVATLQFEGTLDGTTFFALTGTPITGGAAVTSATGTGQWSFAYAPLLQARVRCSAFTSGTAVVTLRVSSGAPGTVSAAGGGFSVTQGTSPWVVAGGVAPGAAVSQNPLLIAGQFGGNIKMFGMTTAGEVLVSATTPLTVNASGNAASGAAVTGNPVLIAGSDATNARALLTDTSGRPMVVGSAATGAAVAGNPVYVGGKDGSGNTQPVAMDTSGRVNVVGGVAAGATGNTMNPVEVSALDSSNNNQYMRMTTALDNDSVSPLRLQTAADRFSWNGGGWDRDRNNVDATLLASAARTTLQNSANITTYNAHGVIVTLDLTASGGAISLTPSINYIDPASGKTLPLLTATTIAATGTFTYEVGPNIPSGTVPYTKCVQAELGRVITINIAVGNANSQTYSVGYTLVN